MKDARLPPDTEEEISALELRYSRRNRVDLDTSSDSILNFAKEISSRINALRKRSYSDDQMLECVRHVKIVTLDVLSAWHANQRLFVGYSRGKSHFEKGGSYWNWESGQSKIGYQYFLDSIDYLAEQGYIESEIAASGYNNYSSRIRATQKLVRTFDDRNVNWAAIGHDPTAPVIIVKDEQKRIIPIPDGGKFDVVEAEKNFRRINANLMSSLLNLNLADKALREINSRLSSSSDIPADEEEGQFANEPLDFSNRTLRRIFAMGKLDQGGRFYGGWWQSVPERYRKFIEIEGLVSAELDYSSMQAHILYANVDVEPPVDAYAPPGWEMSNRKLIKKTFSQILNCRPAIANPKQWRLLAPSASVLGVETSILRDLNQTNQTRRLREIFHEEYGRSYDELISDLIDFHQPIRHKFFSKAWGTLQFIDSQIAERTMIRMLDASPQMTVLPIHDSFIVRRGGESSLDKVMKQSFKEIVGTKPRIDRNATLYDRVRSSRSNLLFWENVERIIRTHAKTHTLYNLREVQWRNVHGNQGYE